MATLLKSRPTDLSFLNSSQPVRKREGATTPHIGWRVAGVVALCVLFVFFYGFLLWLAATSPPLEGPSDEGMNWYIGP